MSLPTPFFNLYRSGLTKPSGPLPFSNRFELIIANKLAYTGAAADVPLIRPQNFCISVEKFVANADISGVALPVALYSFSSGNVSFAFCR